MSVQQTKRWIEQRVDEVYRDVFNALDCDVSIDSDTAASCAMSASCAVRQALLADYGCESLVECYRQDSLLSHFVGG